MSADVPQEHGLLVGCGKRLRRLREVKIKPPSRTEWSALSITDASRQRLELANTTAFAGVSSFTLSLILEETNISEQPSTFGIKLPP